MSVYGGLRFSSWARTDVGLVRKHNEDALLERPDLGLWVVADGMGGHEAGDFASAAIVEALGSLTAPTDGPQFLGEVRRRLAEINRMLIDEAANRGRGAVIGSTVVVLVTFGGFFACLWAGDSRLYRLRAGELVQVTHDHSQVQEMVDAGLLRPEDAERHPFSNIVTRAVGVDPELVLDKVTDRLMPDDLFVLCTDGLCKLVADEEVRRILLGTAPDDAPARLVEAALARGGNDNVSVIIMTVSAEQASAEPDELSAMESTLPPFPKRSAGG